MVRFTRREHFSKLLGVAHERVSYLAVFDVDETLISIKSMFSFLRFVLISDHGMTDRGMAQGVAAYGIARQRLEQLRRSASREEVNREFYRLFRHRRMTDLRQLAREWFAQETASNTELFIPETCALVKTHRQRGAVIVFLSGSADFILEPIVEHLGGGAILAIRLAEQGGVTTGEIDGIQTIGPGKRQALLHYAEQHGLNFKGSVAVGDHISDLPFLELARHPLILRGDPELETIAVERGWAVIETGQLAQMA